MYSVALRRSRQDLICTIYPHFSVAANTEVALGATNDDVELNLVDRNLGRSSLRSVESVRSVPVTVRPLDEYLSQPWNEYEAFVIKIDVEGFEDEVLVPFLNAIPRRSTPSAILLETQNADFWCTDLRIVLKQRGYEPYFDGEDGNTLFLRAGHDGESAD